MDNFEIYISKEAEVRTVPLSTLPVSTRRRMGLPSLPFGSANTNSSATWISPVVVRERVCSPTKANTANAAKAKIASLMSQERLAALGPYMMPFVTSNSTAFSVLGDFVPSSGNPKQQTPARTDTIPHGNPPVPHQDAVIIFHGRVYLSVKKAKPLRGPPGTRDRYCSPALSQESWITCNAKQKTFLQSFGVTRCVQVNLRLLSQEELNRWATVQGHSGEEAHPTDYGQSKQKKANDLSPLQTGSDDVIEANVSEMEDLTSGEEEIEAKGVADVATFSAVDFEMEDAPAANTRAVGCPLPFTAAMSQRHDFDFDELAREEAIDRIRAKRREMEAALNKLPR